MASYRELSLSKRIPRKEKVTLVLATFEFVLFGSAFVWWLRTAKRLPGPLGRWLAPPPRVFLNQYPTPREWRRAQAQYEMRLRTQQLAEGHAAALRASRAHDEAVRELGREPTSEEWASYFRPEVEQPGKGE